MSKKCELTGKIPLKGHKVSHANNKTKRRFLPNLKKVKFKSDILKKNLRLTVSNAGVRSVDKTKRKFLPNLKKVKFKSEILNKSLRLSVSNAGVRSVDKKGSFDQFIKSSKAKNLSIRLKKIKKVLLSKSA